MFEIGCDVGGIFGMDGCGIEIGWFGMVGCGMEIGWKVEDIGCEIEGMFENTGCGLKIGLKFGKEERKFDKGFGGEVCWKFEIGCEID